MIFQISHIAREYIYKRFPNASKREKEKYILDWQNKVEYSLQLVKDFESRVGPVKGKSILDVGCGNGGVCIAFALNGAVVSGVEIEKDLYEIAIRHSKEFDVNVDFKLYDGTRLPYEDGYFDYAISASVLEHTDDPAYYLAEIFRVIKPRGCVYLGFPNKYAPTETHTRLFLLSYLPKFIQDLYIKIFQRNPLRDNNLHFYSYFDLVKMLDRVNSKSYSEYKYVILEEKGKSNNVFINLAKKTLSFFGISYKIFLKHILVILQKVSK